MRVTMISPPSPGKLGPFLGVAVELKRRGHQVSFLLPEPVATSVRAREHTVITTDPRSAPQMDMPAWGDPVAIAAQYRCAREVMESTAPDLVLADQFLLGVLLAARTAGVSLAVMGVPYPTFPSLKARPVDLNGRTREPWYSVFAHKYNLTASLLGLPGVQERGDTSAPLLGDLYFLRSVAELVPPTDWMPAQVRLVGACLWHEPEPDDGLAEWLAEAAARDRPVVYVEVAKLFRFRNFLPDLFDAVEDLGMAAAAAIGPYARRLPRHDGAVLSRPRLDQRRILAVARGSVSTGHPTSVLGALAAGVPPLIINYGSGASEMGKCLTTAGVGRVIGYRQGSFDEIRSSLAALCTSAELRAAAGQAASALDRVPSFVRCADDIEGLRAGPGARVISREQTLVNRP
jgi:UDP:flavonoid glycosyltransferase YjiC (YdhE family)